MPKRLGYLRGQLRDVPVTRGMIRQNRRVAAWPSGIRLLVNGELAVSTLARRPFYAPNGRHWPVVPLPGSPPNTVSCTVPGEGVVEVPHLKGDARTVCQRRQLTSTEWSAPSATSPTRPIA